MGQIHPASFTPAEIEAVARHQKKMFAWFAVRFIATGFLVLVVSLIARNTPAPSGPEAQVPALFQFLNYVIQAVYWICSGFMFHALYYLSRILRLFSKTWLLWAVILICFFVGILGVLFLLYAIIQSNRVLKAHGIKIGLMGADRASVEDFLKRNSR